MYLIFLSFPAVGIQMKLEFFQRKFWTASRQVHFKLKFSLSLNTQQWKWWSCHKQTIVKKQSIWRLVLVLHLDTEKENSVMKNSCWFLEASRKFVNFRPPYIRSYFVGTWFFSLRKSVKGEQKCGICFQW